MATGRLGAEDLLADTDTTLYQCPSETFAAISVNICNRNNQPALITLAVSATETPDPGDYVEYETELAARGTLERTGVVLAADQYLVIRSNTANVNAVAYGIESALVSPVAVPPSAPSPTPTPTPTYSATRSPSTIDEGDAVTINVTTTNVDNGTTLYWTVLNGSTTNDDFTAVSGSFTITSNAGSFTVTTVADATTESTTEEFQVQIRTGSTSGTVVATTLDIVLNDTSQTPAGPGSADDVFTVGDGLTLSITTSTGAAERIDIVTSAPVPELTGLGVGVELNLVRTGGSGTVIIDGDTFNGGPVGDGTWLYSYLVQSAGYPGDNTWTEASRAFVEPTAPSGIGALYQGGYYAGDISVGGRSYYLVVAPKAQEQILALKNASTSLPAGCVTLNDGHTATLSMIGDGDNTVYPAAWHCYTQTTGGYTDWYMPARDEIEILYRNLKPGTVSTSTTDRPASPLDYPEGNPFIERLFNGHNANSVPPGDRYTSGNPGQTTVTVFQAGQSQAFEANFGQLASTDGDVTLGWFQWFDGGEAGRQVFTPKTLGRLVRPVRRVRYA